MRSRISAALLTAAVAGFATVSAQSSRQAGVLTSMWGTYVARGQLLIFPFYSASVDHNFEYQPLRLGYGLAEDFEARFRQSSAQLFLAYGVSDRLALELETGVTRAVFHKSAADTSATPARIEESGLADVEGQIRWRTVPESGRRPEIFTFLEITAPVARNKVLIGDRVWDLRPGVGVIRAFSWGTLVSRVTVEYNHDDRLWDLGEFSIEYLKRLSPAWHVNAAFEGGETGAMDEWTLVTGAQWQVRPGWIVRFDQAVGLFPKATDWEPQVGVMLTLPR